LERGEETGYLHWQLLVILEKKSRRRAVKSIFGETTSCRLSRSEAANAYVWKDETAITETRFELGSMPIRRSAPADWTAVYDNAKRGRLDDIPADIRTRCYNQLRRIQGDHLEPIAMERKVFVLWGATGTGKSRRAWDEAGFHAYPKDPRSKFWDGYRNHQHVVFDEFRGGIDISHMLRWLDRYPVLVEVKGSSTVLSAEKIWITSNIHPRNWYPDLDVATLEALLRRLEITQFFADGSTIDE